MGDFEQLGPEGSYYEAKAREAEQMRRRKLDSIYPTIIVVIYLLLGFGFGLWHPGWLIFLTIPLHYTHFESRFDQLTNPVMVALIYLAIGCFFGVWHPTWLLFFLVPISRKLKKA